MLLGDFTQLPPVGDKPIYASPSQSSSLLTQHGYAIRKYSTGWKKILKQKNFEQYSFAYETVRSLKMTR